MYYAYALWVVCIMNLCVVQTIKCMIVICVLCVCHTLVGQCYIYMNFMNFNFTYQTFPLSSSLRNEANLQYDWFAGIPAKCDNLLVDMCPGLTLSAAEGVAPRG